MKETQKQKIARYEEALAYIAGQDSSDKWNPETQRCENVFGDRWVHWQTLAERTLEGAAFPRKK